MKIQVLPFIVLFFFVSGPQEEQLTHTQDQTEQETTKLFRDDTPLNIQMRYSNKELKRDTNDSTYIKTELSYLDKDESWQSLEVNIRARGNWRRENCFLAPVKVKIKKSKRKGTVFKGNKELKFVLPCQNSDRGQDYIIKEYMAYKLYEVVSPYHFKTRRLKVDLFDVRKNKEKEFLMEGFAIEDITEVAKRNNGRRGKALVHPLGQDNLASVQNDFFQFMIGNTDYSSSHQHNEKIIYVKGKNAIPVPYDFDMSGLVDASYAVVSQVQGEVLDITDVRERLFRGFKRDPEIFEQVRNQYLENKDAFLAVVDGLESEFISHKEFNSSRRYILEFFDILSNDRLYNNKILSQARTKVN